MICRMCIRRASPFIRSTAPAPIIRSFSTSLRLPNAAAAAAATPTPADAVPANLQPLADGIPGEAEKKEPLSSCPAGTKLQGLNYFKGKEDPVAKPDDEYPEWLWSCLDVQKKATEGDDADLGDEFSKSKKQRKLALKRQRLLEAKILASGDLTALAPKIPLQKQSINLPGNEDGTVEDNLVAAEKREELRKALRKERKAKIKESNYLQSM